MCYFAFGKSEDEVISIPRPGHRSDCTTSRELVTNGLFLAPLEADLVHKDDIITLGDRDLLTVGRKLDRSHNIRLLAYR
jgi:hypothetical protein